MVIKTDLVDASGGVKDATITIEGNDGHVILTGEIKEKPHRILRLAVDKFEQKN
ncbi:MAG TPA: hypothetical protein VNR87_11940 [Flavisolibacter sp.]|nr:hypothetical protein [Flavisolibacter sp.]